MKIAALVALTSLGLLAAGCGESTTSSGTTTTTGDKNGAKTMEFAITDAGCEPNTAETTSGLVTFNVENKGAAGVTELEVIKDKRILGEVENLADGLNGHFSLTLQPGDYELYCPNGTTQERGTLTVTGDTVASDDNAAARKAIAAYKAYVIGQAALLAPRDDGSSRTPSAPATPPRPRSSSPPRASPTSASSPSPSRSAISTRRSTRGPATFRLRPGRGSTGSRRCCGSTTPRRPR